MKRKYEQIWSTQQAINTAIEEERVVLFKTDKTNSQIKSEIIDMKNCVLRKPEKNSNIVAVIPSGIDDFCFTDNIDESLIIQSKPIIYI